MPPIHPSQQTRLPPTGLTADARLCPPPRTHSPQAMPSLPLLAVTSGALLRDILSECTQLITQMDTIDRRHDDDFAQVYAKGLALHASLLDRLACMNGEPLGVYRVRFATLQSEWNRILARTATVHCVPGHQTKTLHLPPPSLPRRTPSWRDYLTRIALSRVQLGQE